MKRKFKKIGAILLATAAAMALTACESSGLTDSRDGKTYKTVKIGEKVWMAENLNYQTGESKCYANKPENCEKYGRLYIWREAVTACPDGWHLPSMEEFEELRTIAGQKAGDKDKAGIVLKSTTGWAENDGKSGNGTDALGFAALPAGRYYSDGGYFDYEGELAFFWSSTEYRKDFAYRLGLGYFDEGAYVDYNLKDDGFSVRCLKNSN